MRGRLIFPFIVELAQLDTQATEADPDGAGPLTSGYDETFREPLMVLADPDDQTGESTRVESVISFPAQIEPNMFEKLEMLAGGVSPMSRFGIVAHYSDLEDLDLVDVSTGQPKIRVNDRLHRILDCDGNLVEVIPEVPGLYVTQVQSRGFGFVNTRNLLLVTFEERKLSARGS